MVEIYKYLKLSKLSVLGYTSNYEYMKEDIISNLNHLVIDRMNKFTIESFIRNEKINQILNPVQYTIGGDKEYIVVDFMNLKNRQLVPQLHYLSNIQYVNSQIDKLLKLVGAQYKILITCQMYNSPYSSSMQFSSGNDLLYRSDFVFSVGEKIEIIKNRWYRINSKVG